MQYNSRHQRYPMLIVASLAAALLQGCGERIDARQAEVNSGLIYKLHDSEPFTGKLDNYAFSGGETYIPATSSVMPIPQRNCVIEVKKGLRDGSATCKSDAGAKTSEIQFKGGTKTGTEKRWDATTGKLVLEAEWQDADHLTKEENFDPSSGNRIYEAVWTKWSYGRQIDGDVKVFDPSGKLARHLVFSGGGAKDVLQAKVDTVPVAAPATAAPATAETGATIKIVGKTADGKYPIYQLEGDVDALSYFSPGLVWTPNDLLTKLVYVDPADVDHGYTCDWVCKDSANHIVGLNPGRKNSPNL